MTVNKIEGCRQGKKRKRTIPNLRQIPTKEQILKLRFGDWKEKLQTKDKLERITQN